jgi:hypothetical protein
MKFGQANRFRFGILTFGILTSNGKGLDVQDPLPGSWVRFSLIPLSFGF